jgi:hypothetical protein
MYQETSPLVATGWQQLYYAALSESDHEKRQRLIRQTENAIGDRYHSVGRSVGPALDDEEIREMAEAVWNLLYLQVETNTA